MLKVGNVHEFLKYKTASYADASRKFRCAALMSVPINETHYSHNSTDLPAIVYKVLKSKTRFAGRALRIE